VGTVKQRGSRMVRHRFRRRIRWWGKKRGGRRTGSPLLGSLGEALFFGLLFLLGAVALTSLLLAQFGGPQADMLRMGFGFGFWVLVLVLSSFLLIGGGGFLFTVLHVGTSAERRAALAKRAANLDLITEAIIQPRDFPSLPSDHDLVNSPGIKLAYRLPTNHSPGWQLSAAAVFCLLWCGLAAALFVVAVERHIVGKPDWLLTAIVVPFLAVAGWSIRFFFRQMSALTVLGPTIVEIGAHPLLPGQTCNVYLSQSGHIRLTRLALCLVCDEEATYQQGTDIRVERHRVVEETLYEATNVGLEPGKPVEMPLAFVVPASAMHSFQSPHNRVLWQLVVRAKPEGRPSFERAFPLVVYPSAPPAVAKSALEVPWATPRVVAS